MIDKNLQWFELMPKGWKKSFIPDLITELDEVIKQEKIEDFKITDMKEKWLRLDISYEPYNEKIEDIIYKYWKISSKFCIACGNQKPCKQHPHF